MKQLNLIKFISIIGLASAISVTANALNKEIGTASTSKASIDTYYASLKNLHASCEKQDLKQVLHNIISSAHVKQAYGDKLVKNCSQVFNQQSCEEVKVLTYKVARKYLFGKIHLEYRNGTPYVHDVYCERDYTPADFMPKQRTIGVMSIPDASRLNCEHTWPKSRFKDNRAKEPSLSIEYKTKVADLHHLYPTESKHNSKRANFKFGNVDVDNVRLRCSQNRIGKIYKTTKSGKRVLSNETYYEPPVNHKGNVARAIFYFSTRYNVNIDPIEESFLKQWHMDDPVDNFEKYRNNEIHKVQGNRNPFIDYPELVNEISDF